MMSRKQADGRSVLVAGTDYTAQRPEPHRPSDPENWDWIRYKNRPDSTVFTHMDGRAETVIDQAQIEVDRIDALNHITTRNAGVTVLPSFAAQRGVDAGHLKTLLSNWILRPLGIYAVWPDKSRRESLTQLFIRFLADQDLC